MTERRKLASPISQVIANKQPIGFVRREMSIPRPTAALAWAAAAILK